MRYFWLSLLILIMTGCNSSSSVNYDVPVSGSPVVLEQTFFEDVTSQAGFSKAGPSFGAGSWGDVNGDGFADLWVGNHANKPDLYVNNGNGTFTQAIDQYWFGDPYADTHGAVWTDIDLDGSLDLVELVGANSGQGAGPNHVFFNKAGTFIDLAVAKGLSYPAGRGRTPLPIDLNHNGLTDFVFSGFYRSGGESEVFLQDVQTANFLASRASLGFILPLADQKSVQLADLNNDDIQEIIVSGYRFPDAIFDMRTLPLKSLSTSKILPVSSNAQDAAFGDFNNDKFTDVYVARSLVTSESQVAKASANELNAKLVLTGNIMKEFVFTAQGIVTFQLGGTTFASVFIGGAGTNPTTSSFILDPANPSSAGLLPQNKPGAYIGYNPTKAEWTVRGFDVHSKLNAVISATNIQLISVTGLNNEAPVNGTLFLNKAGKFMSSAVPAVQGKSVVAADFDNDMNLDLYIVQSGSALNKENILLKNMGKGVFAIIKNAGGAAGSLLGIGDSVAYADYDQDGYLDLFITNGEGLKPLNLSGPQQLFHNIGGKNHWIEIDLVGRFSQTEGVGAVVYLTSGKVTQKREQNAGIHKNTQNQARIHFGLAGNTSIDSINIIWPSGRTQILKNVAVDQVLRVTEQ